MKRILAALTMALAAATPLSAKAAAALAPNTLTYSGYLFKPGGAVENGTVSVVFTLYEDAGGTVPLWVSAPAMAITPDPATGFFTATLGEFPVFPSTLDFNFAYYLGIKVGTEAEMVPRTRIGSSPRALSVDWSGIGGFNSLCPAGTVLNGFNANGTSSCMADANTAYSAGANGGLTLNGTAFSLTSAGCSAGQVLSYVSPGWGCTTPSTGTVTSVSAAASGGIQTGGTGAAPTVGLANCATGLILKSTGANTWSCQADLDTNTTYAAGTGVTLGSGVFAADAAVLPFLASANTFSGSTNTFQGTVTVQGAGGVTAPQFAYSAAKARTLSIPALTFASDAANLVRHIGWGEIYLSVNPSTSWIAAPVYLPQGAVITGFACRLTDNTTTGAIALTLARGGDVAGTFSASIAAINSGAATASASIQTLSGTVNAALAIVDNVNYSYTVEGNISEGSATPSGAMGFRRCTVTYTVAEAAP
jgi:hypothetical protein